VRTGAVSAAVALCLSAPTDLSIRLLLIVASTPPQAAAAVSVARHAPAGGWTRPAFVP